tara:strand:+ start:284 stop:541 length:258 start_codon:yes stop_codon:yes gene_type:complete
MELGPECKIWSTLRNRLRCEIIKVGQEPHAKDNFRRLVLNDLWMGSSGSSQMARLDIFAQGEKIGQFQADGLILTTPTGLKQNQK